MSYPVLLADGQGEIEVKKSRFLAIAHPFSSEEEAMEFLSSIRKKYWDARHNCYAYTIGSRMELQRSSDDGEPGGTAGRPILELLIKEEIHNGIVVVTRYFGGTLLGTGGLIRAYQAAAQAALEDSTIALRQSGQTLTIRTDYPGLGKIQYLAADLHIPILDTRYTDIVELTVVTPKEQADAFRKKVTEATSAAAELIPGENVEYVEADGQLLLYPQTQEEG